MGVEIYEHRCPFCERLMKYGTKFVKCTNPHCMMSDGGMARKAYDNRVLHMFVKFYTLYPAKRAKRDSLKAWLKLNPDKELYDKIMNHVTLSKNHSRQWKEGYIPYPSTYIRGFKWEDEVDVPRRTGVNMAANTHVDENGYFKKSKPQGTLASKEKVRAMFNQYRIDKGKGMGDE